MKKMWTTSDLNLPQQTGLRKSSNPRGNQNGSSPQMLREETRCSGDGGRNGGSIRVSSNNVSHRRNNSTMKTPLALLHELCTKGNATVVFPLEEQLSRSKRGQQLFQCVLQVTTKHGDVYEGIGVGLSKQNAKHAAARQVLFQIHPGSEAYMIPEQGQPVELEARENVVPTPSMEGIRSCPGVIRYPSSVCDHSEQDKVTSVEASGEEQSGVGEVSVFAEEGHIYITVKLQKSKSEKQQKNTRSLCMGEKIEMVEGWRGPKIEKLKGCSKTGIEKLKSPVLVLEEISEEQNLKIQFVTKKLSSNDGSLQFSCFMEVTPFLNEELSPYFCLTTYGVGDSVEDAQVVAARDFLQMIRLMMDFCA